MQKLVTRQFYHCSKLLSAFKSVLIASIVCLALSNTAHAVEIRLKSPHKIYADRTYIYINAEGSSSIISPATLSQLTYGIPITITYYLELHQENSLRFARKIATLQVIHKVRYDPWSTTFIVEKAGTRKRYASIAELERAILKLEHAPLARRELIKQEKNYFIKSRVIVKIKNYTSYYDLINNLLSVFKYRTTYYISPRYRGAEILKPAE